MSQISSFSVVFSFGMDTSHADMERVLDQFIADTAEANRLQIGGGGIPNCQGHIEPDGDHELTELDRELVKIWLEAQQEISSVKVGPVCIE